MGKKFFLILNFLIYNKYYKKLIDKGGTPDVQGQGGVSDSIPLNLNLVKYYLYVKGFTQNNPPLLKGEIGGFHVIKILWFFKIFWYKKNIRWKFLGKKGVFGLGIIK